MGRKGGNDRRNRRTGLARKVYGAGGQLGEISRSGAQDTGNIKGKGESSIIDMIFNR